MDNREDIRKELEEISPKLARLKRDDGFRVPPEYFYKLQAEVMEKAGLSDHNTEKSLWEKLLLSISFLLRPQLAAAFTVVLLLVASSYWFLRADKDHFADRFHQIPTEDLALYLSDNADEIDEYLLYELADGEEDLQKIIPVDRINDDELEQLFDEFIDDIELDELNDLL